MVNYSLGKIYKIEVIGGDENMPVYVGSTCKQYLSQRMDNHRSVYKCCLAGKSNPTRSHKIFDEYGVDNCHIILLESYPCPNKHELKAREAFYITSLNNVVNKNIPNRTSKKYYEDNADKLKAYQEVYQEANADKIKAYHKLYQEANKDKIKNYRKEYYQEADKDKIKTYRKEYYQAHKK